MNTCLSFAERLIQWQRIHGRHHLPWQTDDPYRIWLSEIMLQQTQVSTVLNYYPRFTKHYPTVAALAAAPLDDILSLWSGLGYYSRAHNLHHAAGQIMNDYHGQFPNNRHDLECLKGVGRSTAAAIAVFAYGAKEAILDGNVKRVLARHAGIEGHPSEKATLETLWQHAESRLPEKPDELRSYTQGLMDLGSLICTRSKPHCTTCPVHADCYAYRHDCAAHLPSKKARRPLPEKDTFFLILNSMEGIYLYRRPDHGIWRNLWSFPEFNTIADARHFALTHGPIHCETELAPFTHRFTHYALHITPIHITITPTTKQDYYPKAIALSKGLPQPVRRLIEQYL